MQNNKYSLTYYSDSFCLLESCEYNTDGLIQYDTIDSKNISILNNIDIIIKISGIYIVNIVLDTTIDSKFGCKINNLLEKDTITESKSGHLSLHNIIKLRDGDIFNITNVMCIGNIKNCKILLMHIGI